MGTALSEAVSMAEQRYAQRDRVMVSRSAIGDARERIRHLRVHRDQTGLYVRIGRRGTIKVYLRNMPAARIVDRATGLAVFYEWD